MAMPDTFALLFRPTSEDPDPVGASARVCLCSSILASCDGREDKVFLSRQCVSVHELRREIDRLQKELEYLWHIGRRSFSDFEQLKKSQVEQAAS
jgi:hypothetical protein